MSPSSRIDRYRPEELLASAGLVDTYRVCVQDGDEQAVLKVLFLDRAEASISRSIAERFLAAGRRALESPAPGIARILEVSDDPEAAFVATELVPGVDLVRLVQLSARQEAGAAKLDAPLAGLLCARVASVLAGACARKPPLFHLGLCPENVLVSAEGRVTVLDFGLGAPLRGMAGCPIEKWHFVAPELIGIDAAAVSEESARTADLYSLGALLHFLLSGQKPVEAATLAELAERAWEPLPEPPGVPNHLVAAVRALTAPDSKERPESAGLVVEWLSGGIDSGAERRVAEAVQALGLRPSPSAKQAASAAPAKPAARRLVSGKSRTAALSTMLDRSRRASARAAPRRIRRWRSGALLMGGALLAFGIGAGAIAIYRASPGSARPVAGGVPPPMIPEEPTPSQVEMMPTWSTEVDAPHDGGQPAPVAERYQPENDRQPTRVPGHLFLDTSPSQADVWVDGVLRGKTPVDLVVGPGVHRVVVIKAGYRILPEVFDTTRGQYARRGLQRAGFPNFGDALLEVQCETADRFPVVLDDEETGLLCPVSRLRVPSGKHHVGIFVPAKRAVVAVEVTVPPGREPRRVLLKE